MAQILITNLTGGKLSLDVLFSDKTVLRENIAIGGSVDVGDKVTVDDLNKNTQIQSLIANGTISISEQAEASDIAEEVKLNVVALLGAPVVADADRIVVSTDWADGTLSLAAQPDVPRNVTATLTDINNSITGGTLTITGKDPAGRTVTEVMSPDGAGGGKTLTGTKIFASIASAVIANTTGVPAAGVDVVVIGVGNVIGLPSDISATTAVKHTYLGGVPVTPAAIAAGVSTSGINANTSTYNGTKLMLAYYNTGE